MHDVFLSYAHEDHDAVERLVEALQEGGLSVFWDRELRPGQRWSDVIEAALNASAAVIVVWSRASAGSSWVKAEAAAAMDRHALMPVRIDDVPIPLPFGQIQTADLSIDDDARFDATVAGIVAALATMPRPAPGAAPAAAPTATAPPRRRARFDWKRALFSFDGRLGRREYWISILILVSVLGLPMFVVYPMVGDGTTTAGLQTKTNLLVGLWFVMLYPVLALTIKRLHDFGASGWWAVPLALLGLLARASTPYAQFGGDDVRLAASAFGWLGTLATILLGTPKGSAAANRYGPPPP